MKFYQAKKHKFSNHILLGCLSLLVVISTVATPTSVAGLSCGFAREPLSPWENIRANQYVFKAQVANVQDEQDESYGMYNIYTIQIIEAIKGVENGKFYTLKTDSSWGSKLSKDAIFIGVFDSVNLSNNPPSFKPELCENDPTIIESRYQSFYAKYNEAITQYKTNPNAPNPSAITPQSIILYASGFTAITLFIVVILIKRKKTKDSRR